MSSAKRVRPSAQSATPIARSSSIRVRETPGWRGRVFESLGPLEEAEAAYRRAAELEPDDVWWHSNLGGVLVKRGSYEAAIASLRRALELDPWHSAARFSLARAYGLSGDLQRARKLRAAQRAGDRRRPRVDRRAPDHESPMPPRGGAG